MTRLSEKLREAIEEDIATGRLLPGTHLDEVELAERHGVRHPGLVELLEMFEVMAELEAMCGRHAARRIGPGELAELSIAARACVDAMESADPDAYYRRNEEFHQIIYQAAGNRFLSTEAARLQKRLRPFRRMQLRARGRMNQSMKEHSVILKALEEGDSDLAAATLRDHVAIQGEKFHSLLQQSGWAQTRV